MMDPRGQHCPQAPGQDPLTRSVPLFDPAQLPLRDWCTGSREDAVTGLVAFPDFHSHIPRAIAAALTRGGLVGLAIGDVDGLKRHVEHANATDPDCYGHLAGNKVMAQLGAMTRSWFHQQPWTAGCAATFGGDEVIVIAELDGAPGFYRAVAELRDRLASELPVTVSFALTFVSAGYLPAERDLSRWKHTFTDRLLAAVDRCLFTHKAARRDSGTEGGVLAVTHLPLPWVPVQPANEDILLPLPTADETLHVLARPLGTRGQGMLLLPCAGPAGLRGQRLRVSFPNGTSRTAVAVSFRGQAAIPHGTPEPEEPGLPLALQAVRERSPRNLPADVAAALERAGLDWSTLPAHEQAHMLHLITESATPDIRSARVTAAIDAVATRTRS
ncbi:hypothetical protein [Streptomyces sp. NPDC050560]|uniref:hypothetical protein n=1 Tax=Streptomyces sp. NPDC050560 TaxID=3365630 RepID=UPI0037A28048